MVKKNRFFTNTMGYFAELVIAKAAVTQVNYETFVASSAAGDLWAFWDTPNASGKQLAVVAGDLVDAANIGKSFFLAYKDANLVTKKTASIVIGKYTYDSKAYAAGAAQVSTATYTGTYSAGQIVHVRIMETTGTQMPFPSYDYSVVSTGTIATDLTALAVKINAEAIDKFVTAGAASNVLTITSNDKTRTFKLLSYIETTTAQPTDASVIALAVTVKPSAAIGTPAQLTELFRYYLINQGAVEFSQTFGTNGEDFGWPDVALSTVSQWGFFILRENREELGVTRNYTNNAKIVVAITSSQLDELVAIFGEAV